MNVNRNGSCLALVRVLTNQNFIAMVRVSRTKIPSHWFVSHEPKFHRNGSCLVLARVLTNQNSLIPHPMKISRFA
jgi:hypothetical protein